MKNVIFTLLATSILILSSCKNKEEKGISQMERVMEIHDEVMPKMSTIGQLARQLKPIADSLGINSKQATALKDLKDANKLMMDWMQGFGDKFDSAEILSGKELSGVKKQLLNTEEEKINEVKEAMLSSIKQAEALLKP